MAHLIFDLATKVVENNQVIWAVFPGKNRRFLDTFLASNAIFLETPGIKLRPKVLEDDDLLRRHIAMSYAIAAYRMGVVENAPSRNSNSYPAKRNASFNSAVGNVRNMFAKMKPGDLVVMGGRSLYQPVIAGEIASRFDPDDLIKTHFYSGEEIPYRKVRWLPVRQERRFLSERLSHLLSNRHAVISLSKPEFADEIYTMAYGDFVFGQNSRYVFPGPKYKNFAPAAVPGIDLLSYFMAAANAYELKQLDEFSKLEIRDAIKNYFEQDVLYSFEIDFASPGEYVVHTRRAALALIVAVLVAATSDTISYNEARAAKIVNSASQGNIDTTSSDGCEVPIQEEFKAIMDSLGATKHNELCKLNKDARDGVGLKVRIKVKKA